MNIKLPTFFSQRNGYRISDGQLALKVVPEEVGNAIMSAFSRLINMIAGSIDISLGKSEADELCEYLWTHFFHRDLAVMNSSPFSQSSDWIRKEFKSPTTLWYTKLDFIESVIYIATEIKVSKFDIKEFVDELNSQFESLSYGYRVVKGQVIEITSDIEKHAIEKAIDNSTKSVRDTLEQALAAHCARPKADYAGSMKNSISAIEIECYRLTGEKNLGQALKKLKGKGIAVHPQLEAAFQNMYNYSNNEKTGIRHGKKVTEDTFVPTAKESLFMLVASSAFINYLHSCEEEINKNAE